MHKEQKPTTIPINPLYNELSIPTIVNDNSADCVNSKDIKEVAKLICFNNLFWALFDFAFLTIPYIENPISKKVTVAINTCI